MGIRFTKDAVKQINALDKPTRKRVQKAISGLPFGDIKKLKGHTVKYRLRVGDYRIVFELSESEIIICFVLPRGSAYKNL